MSSEGRETALEQILAETSSICDIYSKKWFACLWFVKELRGVSPWVNNMQPRDHKEMELEERFLQKLRVGDSRWSQRTQGPTCHLGHMVTQAIYLVIANVRSHTKGSCTPLGSTMRYPE